MNDALDDLPDVDIQCLVDGDMLHPLVDENDNIVKYVNTSNLPIKEQQK